MTCYAIKSANSETHIIQLFSGHRYVGFWSKTAQISVSCFNDIHLEGDLLWTKARIGAAA